MSTFDSIIDFATKHSKAVGYAMIGMGVATTIYGAVKTERSVNDILEQHHSRLNNLDTLADTMSPAEVKKAAAKVKFHTVKRFILCSLPIIAGTSLIFGGAAFMNHVASGKIAKLSASLSGMSAAYSIAEKTIDGYEEKLAEKIKDPKELDEVKTKVKQRVEKEINDQPQSIDTSKAPGPISSNMDFSPLGEIETGHGHQLIFDPWHAKFFRADPNWVISKINEFNQQLAGQSYMDAVDFFYKLSPHLVAECDKNVGWNESHPLRNIDMIFTNSGIRNETHESYLIMNLSPLPFAGYDQLY